MLWITLLLALLISLAALAYVLWPLLTQQPPALLVEDDRLMELLARKDSTLRALKDLEFDHQVGKLSEEDYTRFYERLSRQAVALIGQIEKVTPQISSLDEAVEAEIAKQRRVLTPRNGATKTVAAAPVATGTLATSPSDGTMATFCTECGIRLQPGFKFCANCGAPVTTRAPVADGIS
jgi:biopolymer transport protein ExbB/TolQ